MPYAFVLRSVCAGGSGLCDWWLGGPTATEEEVSAQTCWYHGSGKLKERIDVHSLFAPAPRVVWKLIFKLKFFSQGSWVLGWQEPHSSRGTRYFPQFLTVLPVHVRSRSHERSEAIEGDGVQLKKLPLKQFAPKGGVTNVGVLGIAQMAGSMEIDGGETKRFGMSPKSIWQPIITCQMPYHAIPTDTKMTYCTHLYIVHVSGTYRAVNVKPNSFGTESGFWRISQRSSNVMFLSAKWSKTFFRIIFIYFQSLALHCSTLIVKL